MIAHKRYFLLGWSLMLTILCLDQWSKGQMLGILIPANHQPIEITSFFDVIMVWNTGISFGMLAGQHALYFLITVSVLITAILLVWLARNTSRLVAVALGFIIGGATGNVIDRLRFGAVVDFLDFHIGNYHWPAFNIADSAIFIGVVLLCASSMLGKSHQESHS